VDQSSRAAAVGRGAINEGRTGPEIVLVPSPVTEDHPERHLVSHVFNVVMVVFGVGALIWMIRNFDWDELHKAVAGTGAYVAIVIGLDLGTVLLDARAQQTFMRPEARKISYWRVVAAQISGRAVNVVTPFGALGEATKLTMLVTRIPRARVLSGIVLFNLVGLYLSVVVMLIGTPITLLLVDLPSSVKTTAEIGLAVLVPLMIALGVIVHRGASSTITTLLHRVHLVSQARLDAWQDHLREVDRHIRELHKDRSTGTWHGILWILASRLVSWVSTMTLIGAVGVAITPTLVIGFLSVGALISWIASVVPLGLGVADGGNYVLFDLLGASGPQGAFVTMLSRARSLLVALVGFLVMAIVHTLDRVALGKRHRELRARKDPAYAR